MNLNAELLAKIEDMVQNMSVDDLCGQVLCFNVDDDWQTDAEVEKFVGEIKPGGFFLKSASKEKCDKFREIFVRHTGIAPLLAADVENGPECLADEHTIPQQMAFGAANDEELTERVYRSCAAVCRKNGVNMTFSPVVDLNMNPDNPVTNTRAISDNPELVSRIGGAIVRGFQRDGLVVTTCKHFPGDGVDDRNQHFCTTVNSLSKDEWMNTFGKVYKDMFREGTAAVMVGHICLPSWQDESEYDEITGYKPGTLSYCLQTKLLKEQLGFDGCIVSDAMSMIGACAAVPIDRLAIEFFKAGGDFMLYPLVEDFYRLKKAVEDGELSIERMRDAVRRVLKLKAKARLFEDEETVLEGIHDEGDMYELADKIGEKCIKIVRNSENLLPLKLDGKKKFLIINIRGERNQEEFDTVDKELIARGHSVTVLTNPKHYVVNEMIKEHDVVLVNCKISAVDYGIGGSLRAQWEHVMPFWRGYMLTHPCVIFTSFGDPYKLYDYPYLKTYVNAHSNDISAQKGFVKVLLGEIEPKAINPVTLKGFFTCEA